MRCSHLGTGRECQREQSAKKGGGMRGSAAVACAGREMWRLEDALLGREKGISCSHNRGGEGCEVGGVFCKFARKEWMGGLLGCMAPHGG